MTDRFVSNDLLLLKRFEPVIRYTRGERFFPVDVERYIHHCSFWVQCPGQPAEMIVSQGELTIEKLVQPRQHGAGAVYFLKLIEPLDLLELAKYSWNQAMKALAGQETEDVFRAGRGRLARVGYGSRLVDALFSITFLMRGRVPGDTAAAAALTYRRIQAGQDHYSYYGRVVRENDWVILQYWFFYPFNNWRSGFFGLNDHEGDWEMITLYCSKENKDELSGEDKNLTPRWVAYASHDFSGDDLRRRWDDPELEKTGCHPVIYAGAGSHASYYSPGEYLAELELPFLSPLVQLVDGVQSFWANRLRQGKVNSSKPEFNVFRIPFVDYARGDGLSIGPGQVLEWEASVLDESCRWATDYRGLWGWYARDLISGENAPAGPIYNRDGSVRRSWYDPLGWAGLDKVSPPDEALQVLSHQRSLSLQLCASLKKRIAEKSAELLGLGVESAAVEGVTHLAHLRDQYDRQIATLSNDLSNLRNQLTVEEAKLVAFDQHEERIRRGDFGSIRAHIHRAHRPSADLDLRLTGLAESFAAISIGVVMIAIVLLTIFARQYLIFGLAALIGLLIFIEAGFRRRLSQMISSLVTGLAIVSAFILVFEFFWPLFVIGVLAAGVFIMWENIREIRS